MKNTEPAFPIVRKNQDGSTRNFEGMTLRDYLAAKAMQGFLSNRGHIDSLIGNMKLPVPNYLANLSYEIADAMLTEREKPCQTQP